MRAPDIAKWMHAAGRIHQYPRRPADQAALLEFVARKIITAGEVLTEPQLNQRLASFSDDIAASTSFC
ncbi:MULTISPECIES: DUF2087 domain-containing protein [Microbacterium]|uniref:DUF2087 domain-containing protein n=1 Tax=Microbacterium TaxID=33882 RepID=UPI0018CE5EAC|nr:DUF2087 domain-containing protein [Microbacterium sp. Ag1]